MERDDRAQRPDGRKRRDLPVVRDQLADGADATQHDHAGDHDEAKDKGEFELAQDLRHLFEKGRVLGLLARRAPRHVDAEHVAGDGLANVDRDATEEDGQQRQPRQVLEEGADQAAALGAVAQDGERDGAKGLEDNDNREVDLEAVGIVVVQVAVEPADQEVVGHGEDPGAADGVVGADVGHDGDLGHEGHVAGDEFAEERRDGPARGPVAEWLEDEFRAAIGVFFPTGKFVVDGERHAFLETAAEVGTKAEIVAL